MILTEEARDIPLSEVLIEVLVCPRDHADLRLDGNELICVRCGERYPIEDGVPNMLIDRD
jgi:uncharacterized protein